MNHSYIVVTPVVAPVVYNWGHLENWKSTGPSMIAV